MEYHMVSGPNRPSTFITDGLFHLLIGFLVRVKSESQVLNTTRHLLHQKDRKIITS